MCFASAAGGLCRPDLFRAMILKSPFLDVFNAMMDSSHPLTKLEVRLSILKQIYNLFIC
jgi:protease II